MKAIYSVIIFLICTSDLYPQEIEYVNNSKDTLFFQWNIIDYGPTPVIGSNIKSIQYNGTQWVYKDNTQNLYVSTDNLQSWSRIPTEVIRGLSIRDFEALPNNKVLVLCDSIYSDSLNRPRRNNYGILEIADIDQGWSGNRITFFNDKSPRNIIFKNESEGIVSCSSSLLYKTTDGGVTWKKLIDFKEILQNDSAHFASIWDQKMFLRESGVLIFNLKRPAEDREILIISRDFGETWLEPRYLPKYVNSADYWGCYARNDSIWATCRKKNQNESLTRYECLYFSTDMGKSWTTQYLSLPEVPFDHFTSIEFFDNSTIGLMCETNHRVFITFDAGERWINLCDSITLFGYSDMSQFGSEDYAKYRKYILKKANNKMYFFGENRTFVFNNLNLPKSVADEETNEIKCYYNSDSQSLSIDSKLQILINKVELFDITGKKLYSANCESFTPQNIEKFRFYGSKTLFAIIHANNQIFIKQIACD